MIKGKDFIFFGWQSWDTPIGSNCVNIAMETAKNNRVLYINRPADRITLWRDKTSPDIQHRRKVLRGELGTIERIHDSLWVYTPPIIMDSINWISNATVFNYLNKVNSYRWGRSIQQAIDTLGFKDYYLFNDNEFLRGLFISDVIKPKRFIYYIRDFLLAQDYFKKHGERTEPAIIKKADAVVTNSSYLANYGKKYNPKSYFIGQGCDLSAFDPAMSYPVPVDISAIPRPIVGYAGALLEFRLEIETIRHIATARPDWSVVLVGPEDDAFKRSDLHTMKNVFFLGSKPFDQVPSYINSFDVCINPQAVNLNTIGNYPRKVDEYLALGKPVVATTTEAMEMFADHTYLCGERKDYPAQIEKAMKENSNERQEARRNFALAHSWENNVSELYSVIENQH